jgi:hypothetical protein
MSDSWDFIPFYVFFTTTHISSEYLHSGAVLKSAKNRPVESKKQKINLVCHGLGGAECLEEVW